MCREKSKWNPHEGESTNAEHGGGAARSSDEAPVMGVERRGCIDRSYDLINHYVGGTIE